MGVHRSGDYSPTFYDEHTEVDFDEEPRRPTYELILPPSPNPGDELPPGTTPASELPLSTIKDPDILSGETGESDDGHNDTDVEDLGVSEMDVTNIMHLMHVRLTEPSSPHCLPTLPAVAPADRSKSIHVGIQEAPASVMPPEDTTPSPLASGELFGEDTLPHVLIPSDEASDPWSS